MRKNKETTKKTHTNDVEEDTFNTNESIEKKHVK